MSAQILLRLGIAALLAGVIGLERQLRGKSAGLRTHTLVGLGSALVMIVSQRGFYEVLMPQRIVLDPSRVAAQVVSGIGFLGAGLIIVRRNFVHGLTTAAGIWVCAAIGLACGSGMIEAATATTVLSLLLIYLYAWIEHRWLKQEERGTTIRVVCREQADLLGELTDLLGRATSGVQLVGVERVKERPGYVSYAFHTRNGLSLETVAPSLLQRQEILKIDTEPSPQDHEREI